MKGLFLAFGLIAALFISNSQASIFDTATYILPDVNSNTLGGCSYQYGEGISNVTPSDCSDYVYSTFSSRDNPLNILYNNPTSEDGDFYGIPSITYYIYQPATAQQSGGFNLIVGRWVFTSNSQSKVCPPKSNLKYTFSFYNIGDSEVSRCYDPSELDNASKCADLFNSGSILTAGSNVSPLVCKTFDDGSRCAFSRVEQGTTPYYQPNLEKGCFGDAEEIPDYDKDAPPLPQPEQCVPYFGGFACSADPKNYCSSDGSCIDGCGYVNDQFMCFRDEECKGASCSPAPVDCTTVPDAPICKDQDSTPDPSFCEKNPTLESCQGDSNFCKKNPLSPSCQLGGNGSGSGAGKFTLDYDKLINGMKDAVKLIVDPNETPEFSDFKSEIDDKTSELDSNIDDFMNGSHFDGINEQISANPFSGQFQLPSGGGCSAFDLGGHSLDLCGAAQKVSSVLYFVFSFLTLLYLKNLFFSTVTPRKE
ncbi:hypothetical protein [Shewanella glacialipiscicola]|uniref:hypothetical protein n=1 Tax=Shewanella glacialipiscicola TaxID=614069 RepID=UPI003D7A6F50